MGFAAGLGQGNNFGQGVGYGLQYAMQGQQQDDANAIRAKEEAARQQQMADAAALKEKYTQFFTQQGRPDIAQGIADGIVEPGAAYMDFIKPQDAVEPIEINGQLVDPVTREVLGDYRDQSSGGGYRPATAEEKAAYGLPPDAPAAMGPKGIEIVSGADKYAKTTSAAARQADGAATASDIIVGAAAKARELSANPLNVGLVGAGVGFNPQSDAAELRRQVDVLKANASIENLTAMRQESPTGAALGSVTERENAMLAAAAGALNADASPQDFQRALDNYEQTLLRIVHGRDVGDRIFQETRTMATPPGGGTSNSGMDDVDEILRSVGVL
jgi:hypothetical protein